jgi:DNA repair protein RecN (Recombination protein N)
MLKELYIQNYALIASLDIKFEDNFSIITGETGAGKSIIMGALSLVLGNRADMSALYNQEKKCVIEAVFDISSFQLQAFFKDKDIDYDSSCILRREINVSGKSRAFINDTPVQLSLLKELSDVLIDIHSQNTLLDINQGSFQLAVVDKFAANESLLFEYKKAFQSYKRLNQELEEAVMKEKEMRKEEDYIRFLANELEVAALENKNQQEMEEELQLLSNAEEIKQELTTANYALEEAEDNSIARLRIVEENLRKIGKYDKRIEEISKRLSSNIIDLQDIADEIAKINDSVDYNQSRIEQLTNELNSIYALEQKHQVDTIEDLLKLKAEIDEKMQRFSSIADEIEKLEKERNIAFATTEKYAEELRKKRLEIIPEINNKIIEKLQLLAMPNANFGITHQALEDFTALGKDSVQFVFSANKGQEMQAIKRIASGGELSRLMFSIKAVLSEIMDLPTMIFDEIDSGISGEVASKLAKLMKEMAKKKQIIVITHLPQIAAAGECHFYVSKSEEMGKTTTLIKRIDKAERIQEIASMISGEKGISETTLQAAREMLD